MSSIENKGKVIYLDNAATTKMSEEVKEAMDPYLEEKFGNASTMYGYGETSRQALEKARKTIAGTLEAKPSEIFFTSGGSESDNWAVKCIAGEYKHKGKHQGTAISARIAQPVKLVLMENGNVYGENLEGIWSMEQGTCYMTITYGEKEYNGVFCQMKDEAGTDVMTFSAAGADESVWGVKYFE